MSQSQEDNSSHSTKWTFELLNNEFHDEISREFKKTSDVPLSVRLEEAEKRVFEESQWTYEEYEKERYRRMLGDREHFIDDAEEERELNDFVMSMSY